MSPIERSGGGGGGTTSPLTTKGDVWGFSNTNARIPVGTDNQYLIANSGQTLGVQWVTGGLQKQYDFTLAADATSIDTNVDGTDAALFPTTGRILLAFFAARVDAATFADSFNLTVNNDAGANYNRAFMGTSGGGTPAQTAVAGGTSWAIGCPGASATAGSFAEGSLAMNGYAATATGRWKTFWEFAGQAQDATAGHYQMATQILQYQTTNTAITRLKMTPTTGGAKLKAGSQLTVYIGY